MSRLAYIREHQQEPLHPHPLSCDLTNDSLLHREEEFGDEHRTRVNWRIALGVVGLLLAVVVAAAIAGSALLVRGDGWSVVSGTAVAAIFMSFVSAPILLAMAVKVSQDEAVRDGVTSQQPTGLVTATNEV